MIKLLYTIDGINHNVNLKLIGKFILLRKFNI